MKLLCNIFTFILWIIISFIFKSIQKLWWIIAGTSKKIAFIHQSSENGENYAKGIVQVVTVLYKHRFDLLVQPSTSLDFIYTHNSFQNIDYLLQDNISLYGLNEKEAIFIEVEKGNYVTDLNQAPFFRLAQFRLAKRLIFVPFKFFLDLGERIGEPNQTLIFLYSMPRCGSTLVCQVLQHTGKAVAYSEPDVISNLTQLKGKLSEADYDKAVRCTINILCRPLPGKNPEAYFIKPINSAFEILPDIVRIFPTCKSLYLYRDGLPMCKSCLRLKDQANIMNLLLFISRFSDKIAKMIIGPVSGLNCENLVVKSSSGFQFACLVWAVSINTYLQFKKKGYEIAAIKYEHLLFNRSYNFQQMFRYCNMEYDGTAVENAFSQDSQRDSPLAMVNLPKTCEEFTDEAKKITDKICNAFELPCFPEEYVAPGTITDG